MLVSCLLTIGAAWPALASQQSEQIPLAGSSASSHQQHAYHSNNASISAPLFVELEELARVVDISYCVGAYGVGIQNPFECPSRCAEFPSFELVTTWNTGPVLSDSCGFIALSHAPAAKRVIVAFRGTYSISNTIADLSTIPQEYAPYPGAEGPNQDEHAPKCENCTVHTGFYTSWANTREVVLPHVLAALEKHPDYPVTLVGHSLGGAVAAFAGLEFLAHGLQTTVTTFGEPRIGNGAMARYLDERFGLTNNATDSNHHLYRRVTHVGDPVPLLPLDEWGYLPHGGEIFISKSGLPPSVADIKHCNGAADPTCIAEPEKGFWAIPARFKLWQLFFAHRDYFWRLGLCVPNMDGWLPCDGHETDL